MKTEIYELVDAQKKLQERDKEIELLKIALHEAQAQRDAYLDQDRKIREIVFANPEDSTLDEVNRLHARFRKFVDLTHAMRDAQNEYFQTRNGSTLYNAKKKEERVDAAIKEYRKREVEIELPFKF